MARLGPLSLFTALILIATAAVAADALRGLDSLLDFLHTDTVVAEATEINKDGPQMTDIVVAEPIEIIKDGPQMSLTEIEYPNTTSSKEPSTTTIDCPFKNNNCCVNTTDATKACASSVCATIVSADQESKSTCADLVEELLAMYTSNPVPQGGAHTSVPTAGSGSGSGSGTTDMSTADPRTEPSKEPSKEPTKVPSEEPTREPTTQPTDMPTADPTTAPSDMPTADPTTVPTQEPTADPTTVPTGVPNAVVGCTNPAAVNYKPENNFEDGSCIVLGCTDPNATNFDLTATGSAYGCTYPAYAYPGCTDPASLTYRKDATVDDGSCSRVCVDITTYTFYCCTDPTATKYLSMKGVLDDVDDGSCV